MPCSCFLLLCLRYLKPFCRILHFLCLFVAITKIYTFSRWNCRKNYWKPINQHFSNYRQKYRYWFKISSNYRWFEEIIGRVIDIKIDCKIIEKKDLSYTPTNWGMEMLLDNIDGMHSCTIFKYDGWALLSRVSVELLEQLLSQVGPLESLHIWGCAKYWIH